MALIAHYRLDGDATDAVGDNHGTIHNNVTWVAGNLGQAAQFNGSNEYISDSRISDYLHGKPEASIAMWVKKDAIQYGFFQLSGFSSSNGNLYPYNNNKKVYLDTFRTNRLGPIYMDSSVLEWHHIVITQKPGEWKLYQNGNLIRTAGADNQISTDYLQFEIGRNSNSRYAKGRFEDVRIYDHALSVREIKDIASKPTVGVYYPKMDSLSATKASIDDHGSVHSVLFKQNPRARYIRDWTDGSTSNGGNHWLEVRAMFDGQNISLNKPVISNGSGSSLTKITNGSTSNSGYAQVKTWSPAWVQVDLGSVQEIDEVRVWHYNLDGRTYYGTKTEISEDGVNWTKIFDSAVDGTYQETTAGITHKALPPGPPGVTVDGVCASEISEVGVTRGLVAWYPLIGDTKDYAGTNHAVNNGAVAKAEGYEFSRSEGDWIQPGHFGLFDGTKSFSVSTVVKATGVGGTNPADSIFNPISEGYFALSVFASGYAVNFLSVGSETVRIYLNSPLGVVRHICMTFDPTSGSLRGYLDGEYMGEKIISTAPYSSGSVNYIGKDKWSGQREYDGTICDVRIHDVALTSEEIAMQAKLALNTETKTAMTSSCLYTQGQIKEVIC